MKPIITVIILTTLYAIFFSLTTFFGWAPMLILGLSVTGILMTVYMAYCILKYGEPTGKTFDEGYWYDDLDRKFSADS